MRTELHMNGSAAPTARYVGWAPMPCCLLLTDAAGATMPVAVRLSNQGTANGGQVIFLDPGTNQWRDTIELTLPLDGTPVPLMVAGKYGHPSRADRDAAIAVRAVVDGTLLSRTPLMVRIRKNAKDLTERERDAFLCALTRLSEAGKGNFQDFRRTHVFAATTEMHTFPVFLPWHRAFLLDLERELQLLDPSVAIPYWRFDLDASHLFTKSFMGVSRGTAVVFEPTNPLDHWMTDGYRGILRAPDHPQPVLDEDGTLRLGTTFKKFRKCEDNPHAIVHLNFVGFLRGLTEHAVRDPLFFLLHCNLDRLWAKWQWINGRHSSQHPDSYQSLPGYRPGHHLDTTMWPWNQSIVLPRPDFAYGGTLAQSAAATAPGLEPFVRDMFDYQGLHSTSARLGFDYDDVPYEPEVGSYDAYRTNFLMTLQPEGMSAVENEYELPDLASLQQMLNLLENQATPIDVRRRSFVSLRAAEIANPLFSEIRARHADVLRALVSDENDRVLRLGSLEALAARGDDFVLKRIRDEIEKPPVAPMLPLPELLRLLVYDSHGENFNLIQLIATTSDDPQAREVALRLLGQSPGSIGLLEEVTKDEAQPLANRRAAALSLRSLDGDRFIAVAKKILSDTTEDAVMCLTMAIALTLMAPPTWRDDAELRALVEQMSPPCLGNP